jgi:hypothetical protein
MVQCDPIWPDGTFKKGIVQYFSGLSYPLMPLLCFSTTIWPDSPFKQTLSFPAINVKGFSQLEEKSCNWIQAKIAYSPKCQSVVFMAYAVMVKFTTI